jgi:hypothetical protein
LKFSPPIAILLNSTIYISIDQVGGKFDNGGRFDLRLPYADQGYVDEDSDVMGKIGNMFSFGSKKATPARETKSNKKAATTTKPIPTKKNGWPW